MTFLIYRVICGGIFGPRLATQGKLERISLKTVNNDALISKIIE